MKFNNPFKTRRVVIINAKKITFITIPFWKKIEVETKKQENVMKGQCLDLVVLDEVSYEDISKGVRLQ